MKKAIDKDGNELIIFTVPLSGQPPVQMSYNLSSENMGNVGVIIIDATKFLQLWKNDPSQTYKDYAGKNLLAWQDDYRYQYIDRRFFHSYSTPVQIASVAFGVNADKVPLFKKILHFNSSKPTEQNPYLSFVGGIAKIIWLLINGCKSLPIVCEIFNPSDIHKLSLHGRFFSIRDLNSLNLDQSVEIKLTVL